MGGVADGTRTHDDQNHNLGLYQLSYSHRKGEIINASATPRQNKGLPGQPLCIRSTAQCHQSPLLAMPSNANNPWNTLKMSKYRDKVALM